MASSDERLREQIDRYVAAVGDANRPAVRAFLDMKHGQGLALNTVRLYAAAIERFDAHLNGRTWDGVGEADVTEWLSGMRREGLAPSTVRNHATYVKAFLAWHRDAERLPLRLRHAFRVRDNRHLARDHVVPDEDFKAFLAELPTLMDQAFAAVVWETGFRLSEAVSLDVGSVDWDEDRHGAWLSIPKDGRNLKTGPRRVYITHDRANLLRAWLQTHPQRDDPHAPLWVGTDSKRNRGHRIGGMHVYNRWARARALAGVRHFTPHDLRHTAATRDAEAGYQEQDLRAKYGWGAKSTMPAHYVHQRRVHQENIARRSVGVGPDGLPVPLYRADPDERPCPFCAERIKTAARKCRHCGEFVTRDGRPAADP